MTLDKILTKDPVPVVMISSTILDLPRHREAVEDACLEMRMFPLPMEHEPSSGKSKVPASLEMVDRADVYLGIIGRTYGTVPKGYRKSMTELEYEEAVRRQIDRRIFVMNDARGSQKKPIPAALVEFKKRLYDEATPRVFKSVPDLKVKVVCALGDYWRGVNWPQIRSAGNSGVSSRLADERRKWLNKLLSNPSPENYFLAAVATAEFATSGAPARQTNQWLAKIEWKAVLHYLAGEKSGLDPSGERFPSSMAKAICDLHSSLSKEAWNAVRTSIMGSLSEGRNPADSESYTLLLRAVSLYDAETAEDLLVRDRIFVDKISDSRQTIIARRELKSLLAPPSHGLRVGLDAWPGYFPLFVMEDRLRSESGISLFDIESSSEKIRMLREKRIDLVGTTPGCLLGQNNPLLSDLRVVAILNQSAGADQILIRGSNWSRKQAPWPDAEELLSATWIVTAGSTSELFAKAFCQRIGLEVPREKWLRTVDYHDALDAMATSKGVAICSTWEPYSSWMREEDPAISVLCTTDDFEPLVVDCLVASKSVPRLELDERVGHLLKLWDECLARNLHLEADNILSVCNRLVRFEPEEYLRMVRGVRYFDSTEMKQRSASGEFRSVFDRVWQAWGSRPEVKPIETAWQHLVHPASKWMSLGPQDAG